MDFAVSTIVHAFCVNSARDNEIALELVIPEANLLKLMELKSVTTILLSLDLTHCFKCKSPKTIRTVTELLSWKLRLLKHQLQLGNVITSLSFRNTQNP